MPRCRRVPAGSLRVAAETLRKFSWNDNVDLVRGEAGNRESDAVGVRTGFCDVVWRIAVGGFIGPIDGVKQSIEADGGTEERSELVTHGGILLAER